MEQSKLRTRVVTKGPARTRERHEAMIVATWERIAVAAIAFRAASMARMFDATRENVMLEKETRRVLFSEVDALESLLLATEVEPMKPATVEPVDAAGDPDDPIEKRKAYIAMLTKGKT